MSACVCSAIRQHYMYMDASTNKKGEKERHLYGIKGFLVINKYVFRTVGW